MAQQEQVEAFVTREVELDVSAAVPVDEECFIGCSLFVPTGLPANPTVVVAVPGATYGRRYWDMQPPGRENFSQARYYAERGIVFAAVDYMGGGERNRPAGGDVITMPVAADAAHAVFEQLRDGLLRGSFGSPPLESPTFVGIGQSYGGNVTNVQQATYGDYAAIATLGTSATVIDNLGDDLPANWDELSEEERRAAVAEKNKKLVGGELPIYHGAPRAALGNIFYTDDIGEDLIRYDEESLHTLLPRNSGIDSMTPGFSTPFAARVTCPVFLCYGDLDVIEDKRAQPQAYPSSRDITLSVIPDMGHMHNFAETRQQLWDRLLLWLTTVSAL